MDDENKLTYKIWLHLEKWDEQTGEGTDQDLPDMLFESKDQGKADHFYNLVATACHELNKLLNGEKD